MSDIKQRLQETADKCLKSYAVWDEKKSDSESRENLQESIHDLRKVASRLEIEIAISERKNASGKPIPIPPHRSQSKAKGAIESILPEHTDTSGDNGKSDQKPRRNNRPRRPIKKQND